MPHGSIQDVVIRSRVVMNGAEFVVLCGATARLLGGPFAGMTDAVAFALAQAGAISARVLYEAHDERGRPIGDRIVLRPS